MTTNIYKAIGFLLIIGSVALIIPFTILNLIFDYPNILRREASTILIKFHQGGAKLIWTWFAFAVTGIPLLPALILMGQKTENKNSLVRIATIFGIIGLVVQIIGLLRWTFVVPVLADTYMNTTDDATKSATIVVFKTLHQFGGVILGEHLGQLFTIAWTVMISISLGKLKLIPQWVNLFGLMGSFIYLLAQADLFATVISGFPYWDDAGFIGSSLWLIWLFILGVSFFNKKEIEYE